ncbi:MAG: hypothetical protein AAFS10_15540, partial [Myxococcota bacterium]
MDNTVSRVAIMKGPIAEVGFARLLQVVGLSRQYTAIEIRGSESLIGAIFVKAGRVLRVQPELPDGRTNFMRLFHEAPSRDFEVYRLSEEGAFPAPLGTVEEMLYEAIVSGPEWEAIPDNEPSTEWPSVAQMNAYQPWDEESEAEPWPTDGHASKRHPYEQEVASFDDSWAAMDRTSPPEPSTDEDELQPWPSMARSTNHSPTVVPMPSKQPHTSRLASIGTVRTPPKQPEHDDALSASLRKLRARQTAHGRKPASPKWVEPPIPGQPMDGN